MAETYISKYNNGTEVDAQLDKASHNNRSTLDTITEDTLLGINKIGNPTNLTTTNKNTLVDAINEVNNTKVVKVAGKQLSSNDFTSAEKTKLLNLPANAEANVQPDWNATSGDGQILNKPTALPADGGNANTVNNKTANGNLTTTEKTNLVSSINEVLTNVTENKTATDVSIKNLSDMKVDKVAGKELSSNDFTTAEKEKLATLNPSGGNVQADWNATTGASVILNKPTALPADGGNSKTVDNKGASGVLTTLEKNSLVGAINEVNATISNKVDKVSGKSLSSNDFTLDEKNKLSGIQTGAEVNVQADWNATEGSAVILNKPTITGGDATSLNGKTATGVLTTTEKIDLVTAINEVNMLSLSTASTLTPMKAELTLATSDITKKVDKIEGKQLTSNDFTTIEKTKLENIQDGAEVNIQADWNATSGDAVILNKPIIPTDMIANLLDSDSVNSIEMLGAKATGENTVALSTSNATAKSATATGEKTYASGEGSFSSNISTEASGKASHAEGTRTTASGVSSHAEGDHTTASGTNSHASGEYTVADGRNQTVIGSYNVAQGTSDTNIVTDYAFIVGNGTDELTRSNSLTLTWDGVLDVAKDVKIGGASITSGVATSLNGKTASGALNTVEKVNLVTAINEISTTISDNKTSTDLSILNLDNTKVSKVEGKVLSSNDFTTAEKTKLATLSLTSGNVQSDWDATTGEAVILNKPTALPADGGNSASVGNKTANGTLSTTEKIDLVTAINEVSGDILELSNTLDADLALITSNITKKVDKEEGKQLSTNDFTTAEKTKLAGLANVSVVNNLTSTVTTTALSSAQGKVLNDIKVDKVEGKVLSSNDFTVLEKTKLEGIQNGAEINVQPDWNATSGNTSILNKPTTLPASGGNADTVGNKTANGILSTTNKVDLVGAINDNFLKITQIDRSIETQNEGIAVMATAIGESQTKIGELETTTNNLGSITIGLMNNMNVIKPKVTELVTNVDVINADITAIETSLTTQATTISNKVDKVEGKQLSANDFTTPEKTKLTGIATGAEVNVQSDWNATSGKTMILNKPTSLPANGGNSLTVNNKTANGTLNTVEKIDLIVAINEVNTKFTGITINCGTF